MKTYQIVLRDVNHLYIETYVIQSERVVSAIRIAHNLFAQRHPKLARHPIETFWNEAFTEEAKKDLTTVKAFTSNPLYPIVDGKRQLDAVEIEQVEARVEKKPEPSPKEDVGSGIFTTIDGKEIELSLVPRD